MSEPLQGTALMRATRPYATDDPKRSMWYLVSTSVIIVGLLTVAILDIPTWARVVTSVVAGLVIVRAFTIYHDHQHHAILRDSKAVNAFMKVFGVLVLAPSNVWRQTHNHHHTHNARLHGSNIGSFEVMTVDSWSEAKFSKKLYYAISRSPLVIGLGYLTVFIGGFCISPLMRSYKRHWDSAIALVVHVGIIVGLTLGFGFAAAFYCVILPMTVASALGAYLFYIQHNFVGVKYHARDDWTYAEAALESSSFLKAGKLIGWFTGNIGYHHIHHLNPLVPFYRLPEAMAEVPELQNPPTTSLSLRDIVANFQLNLWDPVTDRMVRFRVARQRAAAAAEAKSSAPAKDASTASDTGTTPSAPSSTAAAKPPITAAPKAPAPKVPATN